MGSTGLAEIPLNPCVFRSYGESGVDSSPVEQMIDDPSANWLSKARLRPTRQRVALAKLLVGDGQHRHVTAESLHSAAADTGEAVSLATVYNTLRAFSDAGLIQEMTVDGSKSYFDTRTDDHPHFYWEDDARLTDAPADQLSIQRLPEAPEGTEIAKIDVIIRLRQA